MNLICGINPVLEALNAGTRHFDRLLVVKGLRNRRIADALSRASGLGVPLRFEGRETLDRLADGLPHQGIIAIVSDKPLLGLEELLASARSPALLMALDGVEDPRNLGAILRTCEAAGVDGVLLPQRHTAGLSETVSRASAGGLEYVRVARVGNLSQALESLKASGIWVVGLDASGRERWDAVDLKRPVALVVGGEGRGIRRLVRERCDHVVSLPMFGHVGSLNVSVAAGIALYEAVRQRGLMPSPVRPIPFRPSGDAERRVWGPLPDDGETDPGDLRPAGGHSAPARDTEDEGDESPRAFVRIHDEEAAWAGPQVLRSKMRTRDRWQRPGRRSREGKRKARHERSGPSRPVAPRPVEPSEAPEAAARIPAGEADRERRARRRRRRRTPRGDAAERPGPATPTGALEAPAPAPVPPPSHAGGERPTQPADADPGRERRGRRRRRKRRR